MHVLQGTRPAPAALQLSTPPGGPQSTVETYDAVNILVKIAGSRFMSKIFLS